MSPVPDEYSQARYLLAKRTVDDRSLNRSVVDELRRRLASRTPNRLRIVELGAGVGTMVKRLADWGVVERADYLLVDSDAPVLDVARQELGVWAGIARRSSSDLSLKQGRMDLAIRFEAGDALEFTTAGRNRHRFDLVLANAVLDLMDLEPALSQVFQCLAAGGLFWFSINFDGETIFVPEDPFDAQVSKLYHRSMEPPVRHGSSRTGRRLLELIPKLGASLLAAGSSDWVVHARGAGYPADEGYFLHHIVHTIRTALVGHPELDGERFQRWLEMRHDQIEAGRLSYIAHQIDVLGLAPAL